MPAPAIEIVINRASVANVPNDMALLVGGNPPWKPSFHEIIVLIYVMGRIIHCTFDTTDSH